MSSRLACRVWYSLRRPSTTRTRREGYRNKGEAERSHHRCRTTMHHQCRSFRVNHRRRRRRHRSRRLRRLPARGPTTRYRRSFHIRQPRSRRPPLLARASWQNEIGSRRIPPRGCQFEHWLSALQMSEPHWEESRHSTHRPSDTRHFGESAPSQCESDRQSTQVFWALHRG